MEALNCLITANEHCVHSSLQLHQPPSYQTNDQFRSIDQQNTNQPLHHTTLLKPLAAQPFSVAASRQASGETEGKNPDSTHATRKKDLLDVQSANSKEAQE
jgi:hypothetical protein